MAKKWFKAFATGMENNSARVPIDAERIVVVLGDDADGRPLEISISLEQSNKMPNELIVYAIEERWLPTPTRHVAELIMHKCPTTNGSGFLSVRFWPLGRGFELPIDI
jgi:hypothetical protein